MKRNENYSDYDDEDHIHYNDNVMMVVTMLLQDDSKPQHVCKHVKDLQVMTNDIDTWQLKQI